MLLKIQGEGVGGGEMVLNIQGKGQDKIDKIYFISRGGGRWCKKFGDGNGPNLCRVEKVDVSSTLIENIFRSGLTLVSSNDIITIKVDKKNVKKPQENKQTKKG